MHRSQTVLLPFLKPAKSAKISCFLGQVKAKGDVGSGWSQEALLSGAGGDAQDCTWDVPVDSGLPSNGERSRGWEALGESTRRGRGVAHCWNSPWNSKNCVRTWTWFRGWNFIDVHSRWEMAKEYVVQTSSNILETCSASSFSGPCAQHVVSFTPRAQRHQQQFQVTPHLGNWEPLRKPFTVVPQCSLFWYFGMSWVWI